ncbi:hypothetical protein SteCoe_21308 [Stentor coeruleus]|uniref:Uncharacterized protein n=1 Tax=Stentor coeruleus TaxID=5963 RepID=A0A1R2BPY3_9CILI|nr:hypothetical protein SteCoe_21308 [Stentor coeruleus]
MGVILAKILDYPDYENQTKVLLLGEDAAGKSSFIYKLNSRHITNECPTIGVNLEILSYKSLKIVCCDLGSHDQIYKFRMINLGTCGIMFMFDLTDHYRYDEAVKILQNYMSQPETLGLPVLIICNKIDLPVTVDIEKVKDTVKPILEGRVWEIIGTSVIKGVGMKESISWMSNAVNNN